MKWSILLSCIVVVLVGCTVSIEELDEDQLYAMGCCDLPSTNSCAGGVTRDVCHRSVDEAGLGGVFVGDDYQCTPPYTRCMEIPEQNESELEEEGSLVGFYADSSTFGCCEVPDQKKNCYLTANSSICSEDYGGNYYGQEYTCINLIGGCVAKTELNDTPREGQRNQETLDEENTGEREPPARSSPEETETLIEQGAPSGDDSGGDRGCCEVLATNGCASPVSRDTCHSELNGIFAGPGYICDGMLCVVETQGE
jgi:hypothetical protein